jgi:RHS repeat-associated protein
VQYEQDYSGGIEYRKTPAAGAFRIEAIYHEEGRYFNLNVDASNTPSWRKEYALRDHLGNTRLLFADKDGDGMVEVTSNASTNEVLQENHYYPFGLSYGGSHWMNDATRDNGYKYNGKELNEDWGLGWYDYGARWYMPDLGRWGAVDPLAEDYSSWSSYHYVINNPLIHVDPDGMRTSLVDELRERNFGGVSSGGGISEFSKFIYDGDIQSINPNSLENTNKVGNQLVSNIEKMEEEGTINCSKETACYPTVWVRLLQAYVDVYGSAPSVFNNSGVYQYDEIVGAKRWYPKANTGFSMLFGSIISTKKWLSLPEIYRGKGAPGAMAFAGLGEMVTNIWDGSLLSGATLQFWKSNADYLRVQRGETPKSIGHSAIFLRYQRTFWGSISGIVYADQKGIHSMWNWFFRKYPIAFGANTKDLK